MFSWNKSRIRKPDADIWHMKFQLKYEKLQGLWETGKNEFGSHLPLATFVNIAYVKWVGLSPDGGVGFLGNVDGSERQEL